jgi:hypothetical protein
VYDLSLVQGCLHRKRLQAGHGTSGLAGSGRDSRREQGFSALLIAVAWMMPFEHIVQGVGADACAGSPACC